MKQFVKSWIRLVGTLITLLGSGFGVFLIGFLIFKNELAAIIFLFVIITAILAYIENKQF